ncbi:MAG: conjugative transposon protein TraJ [Bacteroides caccae]|nr:conjugative transposon protein TraJ [Bacteroides caccae]
MLLAAVDFDNLHQVLRVLYDEMMPLCSNMTGVAKGIAGLGALFYVAAKVWQSLARAEPIDVYPLLRPFALGLCIMFFPTFVRGTINTVLSPVVKGCNQLMETQTFDMNEYRAQKDRLEYEALMRSPETAYLASDEEFDRQLEELGWSPSDMVTMTGMYMDRAAYNIKKSVRDWFRELLEMLFQAAGLIIDTLRTFFLIVLSILGPLAFAVLARIQTLMLQKDIQELSDPNFIPDGSSTVYVIFMIIGIVGYFTIPTVASWIVSAGGTSAYNRNVARAGSIAGAAVGAASGKVTGKLLK